jgi:hypothetical protein
MLIEKKVKWTGLVKFRVKVLLKSYSEIRERLEHRGTGTFYINLKFIRSFKDKISTHDWNCSVIARIPNFVYFEPINTFIFSYVTAFHNYSWVLVS